MLVSAPLRLLASLTRPVMRGAAAAPQPDAAGTFGGPGGPEVKPGPKLPEREPLPGPSPAAARTDRDVCSSSRRGIILNALLGVQV